MKQPLLIVDDDEEIRTQMKWALAEDYDVSVAGDRTSALEKFKKLEPAVTLLDLGLPPHPNDPEEGMATLSDVLELDRSAKVIIISGQADRDNAMRAVGIGAYDFHTKPVDMDELRLLLQRCIYRMELEQDYRQMQGGKVPTSFEGIIGTSSKMQEVFSTIRKVSASDAPVLILGESGTGKEMVANAIHQQSTRKAAPESATKEHLLFAARNGHIQECQHARAAPSRRLRLVCNPWNQARSLHLHWDGREEAGYGYPKGNAVPWCERTPAKHSDV